MANWFALFPHFDARDFHKLKADILEQKIKAARVLDDRRETIGPDTRRVATVVAMGSPVSLGGHSCGLPIMGDDWLTAAHGRREPLLHDGIEAVVYHPFNFDHGWLHLLRGWMAQDEIERRRGAYAQVRGLFAEQRSPYGEVGVRLALLDEFPHALAVKPIIGHGDRTLLQVKSPERAVLTYRSLFVDPEWLVEDAFRMAVVTRYEARRAFSVRFERDLPVVSFVKHVRLQKPYGDDSELREGFCWVSNGSLFEAVTRNRTELIGELRHHGHEIAEGFALDPADARDWILTV